MTTQEYDDSIRFRRDKAEKKDVFSATVVALGCCGPKRTGRVQCDFFVLGSDEMIDDMGARGRASRVAEPFATA